MDERLDILKPKRLAKSWADMASDSESDSSGDDFEDHLQLRKTFAKRHLSLEEFCQCLRDLVNRTHIDLTEGHTSFHHRIGSTFIDIMFRDYLIISVNKVKAVADSVTGDEDESDAADRTEDVEATEATESSESDTEAEPEVPKRNLDGPWRRVSPTSTPTAVAASSEPKPQITADNPFALLSDGESEAASEPGPETKSELKAELETHDTLCTARCTSPRKARKRVPKPVETDNNTQESADSWSQVISKKTKRLETRDARTLYVFSDGANSPFWDFVGLFSGFTELELLSKEQPWCHGYCLETRTVYDYAYGRKRQFTPNLDYTQNFQKWLKSCTSVTADDGKVTDVIPKPDRREFFVFQDHSTWAVWRFVGCFVGLTGVRNELKRMQVPYAHAFDPEGKMLYNFSLKQKKFLQNQCEAPTRYLERFQNEQGDLLMT
jgi:hypothetical protein